MRKIRNFKEVILPNKGINYFVFMVMVLGILSGSIFMMILGEKDKSSVVLQIQSFFQSISSGSIDSGLALKNSLIINYLFLIIIWFFGFTLIGVICNIFLSYLKGFLVGFSISAILVSFGYKGVVAGILYGVFVQILNIFVIYVMAVYSLMFSYHLFRKICNKSIIRKRMFKRYLFILMIGIVVSFLSSFIEAFVFPNLLKVIIGLYV